jgi:CRP/FNR family transcriptional regulator
MFFKHYPVRKYSKGQILLHFDEKSPAVFYLESGRVRQYDISDNGTEIVVNIFRNNSYFPVHLALTNSTSSYIYEAMSKIEIRKAPKKDFINFFTNSPDVVIDHLKEVYTRSNKGLMRMTYMTASTAYYRIVFELVNECLYTEKRKDGTFRINMHEYEIAESAGLSRETTSREFQKLKEKNLVAVNRKYITVNNIKKLKKELGNHI